MSENMVAILSLSQHVDLWDRPLDNNENTVADDLLYCQQTNHHGMVNVYSY